MALMCSVLHHLFLFHPAWIFFLEYKSYFRVLFSLFVYWSLRLFCGIQDNTSTLVTRFRLRIKLCNYVFYTNILLQTSFLCFLFFKKFVVDNWEPFKSAAAKPHWFCQLFSLQCLFKFWDEVHVIKRFVLELPSQSNKINTFIWNYSSQRFEGRKVGLNVLICWDSCLKKTPNKTKTTPPPPPPNLLSKDVSQWL